MLKRFLIYLVVCLGSLQAAERPNILFVAIDDLNDWLGCMGGHSQAVTPHIDTLAKRGVLFTNAHCAAPVCKASRAAVFSGRQPFETEVYSNRSKNIGLKDADVPLLPTVFARAGYTTWGTGKLLHSKSPNIFQDDYFPEQRWSPFTREQARYTEREQASKGTNRPRHVVEPGPWGDDLVLPINGLVSERHPAKPDGESFDWGPFDVPDDRFGDTKITSWAIDKLAEQGSKPFFLGVGYYRPHIPLFAPKRDFDIYPPVEQIKLPATLAADLDDLSGPAKRWALEAVTAGSHKTIQDSGQWREAVRAYLACVTFVDRQIGRLLAELKASRHSGNTWIVVWSDHGWHLGEKQHWGKWTGWRQSTRVPLLIVPPKNATAFARDVVCNEPVSLLDLYPTLLDAADLSPRRNLSGQSLLPLLRNPQLDTKRTVLSTFDKGNQAVSGKRWRYIRYSSGEEELYDIQKDPNEWHNLAEKAEYRSILKTYRAKTLP